MVPAFLQRTNFAEHYILRYEKWHHNDDITQALQLYDAVLEIKDTNFAATIGKADILRMTADGNLARASVRHVGWLKPTVQDTLVGIYLSYFESSRIPVDLDLAIEQYDHMETLSGDDSRVRANATNNKALALHKKALLSGHLQSYLDGLAKYDDAAKMESTRPAQLIITRLNRAETLRDVYEQLHDAHFGQAALREFSELAETNYARMDLLLRAADVAVSLNKDYGAAYLHAKEALDLLLRAVLLFPNRLEQLKLVRKYHFLPSNETALAIAAIVQASKILANMEQSRAFIWERYLLSETPMKTLREQHEQLANEFERLRSMLITQRPSESNSIIGSALPPKDQLRLERHTHTQSYDELLAKIRQEKGFEHFPLTHAPDDINVGRDEAMPIVYINLNSYRCDAVIAFSKGVKVLALKDLGDGSCVLSSGTTLCSAIAAKRRFSNGMCNI
ncbi:MAG: hypothetical protein Q9217_005633 [Psora testacea]